MATQRGGAFYDKPSVHARYTAHRSASASDPNYVMEEPAVLAEIGDPRGLRILDLGCGDGHFGLQMLDAGCRTYEGIDGSEMMTQQARRVLDDTTATIRQADIEEFAAPAGAFDLITARLSLHYVADLDPVFAATVHSLVSGGRLIFSVLHPVITSHDTPSNGDRTTWTVDRYFDVGPRERTWMGSTVTWHHRTIEHYLDATARAGLRLTALRECEPVGALFDGDTAEISRRRRVPLFLLISVQKP